MASSSAPQSQAARNFKNDLIDFTLKSKMKEPVFRSRDVGKGRVPEFISHVTVDGLDFVTPHTFLQRKAADQEVCKIALEHFIKKQKEVLFGCQDNKSSLPERLLKIQKETKGHAKTSKTIIKGDAGGSSQVVEKVRSATQVPGKMAKKRSVEDGSDPVSKRSRADLTIPGLREEVPAGVPTKKFILPRCISNRELLDVNTEVQVSPVDIVIINDMGPASINKSLMEDIMAVMRVLEIANTLNARDSRYLEDVERLQKKVSELKGEIAKVENDYSNYKEKYVVQEDFIIELGQKVEEINTLKGSNESLTLELYMLVEKKITLENELRLANEKVSSLAEEKEKLESFLKSSNSWPQVGDVSLEEGFNKLKNFDRFALIARICTLENELLTSAQESFDNALAQVRCLNPEVEFKTVGISLLKSVKDGYLKAPEGYVDYEEAKDV